MMAMIKVFRDDTRWALAGHFSTAVLSELARQLPSALQGDGSRVVSGNAGFAALLVFGDVPSERLAHLLLATKAPVYLLDFDDDAPKTIKLERQKTNVTETRIDGHPAEFLEEHGIEAPGFASAVPAMSVGVIENVTVEEVQRAFPTGFEVELRQHPRGVLALAGTPAGLAAEKLKRRAYCVYRNPQNGWFTCLLYDGGAVRGAFSSEPDDDDEDPRLDNILGETTLEGIVRTLEIPGELLGL